MVWVNRGQVYPRSRSEDMLLLLGRQSCIERLDMYVSPVRGEQGPTLLQHLLRRREMRSSVRQRRGIYLHTLNLLPASEEDQDVPWPHAVVQLENGDHC